MRLAFSETLSGGVYPSSPGSRGTGVEVQALTLELSATARGILECTLGAPFAVRGTLRSASIGAESPAASAVLPSHGAVTGTLRFLLSSGLFYDLRIAEDEDVPPRDQLELRGARRFVRGDLFTSATTFDGTLTRRGAQIGDVRLRFDVRDDVPRLLRSVRLG